MDRKRFRLVLTHMLAYTLGGVTVATNFRIVV